jgi:hypothetical protein
METDNEPTPSFEPQPSADHQANEDEQESAQRIEPAPVLQYERFVHYTLSQLTPARRRQEIHTRDRVARNAILKAMRSSK